MGRGRVGVKLNHQLTIRVSSRFTPVSAYRVMLKLASVYPGTLKLFSTYRGGGGSLELEIVQSQDTPRVSVYNPWKV